jgi:hypothetical protein
MSAKAKDNRVNRQMCQLYKGILNKFGLTANIIIGGPDERTNSKTSYDH